MRLRLFLLLLLILGQFRGNAFAQISPAEKAAAASINATWLAAHMRFLSDDLLEGRAPGAHGDQVARQYIATQFAMLGLQPAAGDGSYFQRFDMLGITSAVSKTMTIFDAGGKALSLNYWDEFIAFTGVQDTIAKVENTEIVFVGYGIVAPEQKWDDYKNVEVRGKILLMMNNDPSNDPKWFEGKRRMYYGRWTYKYEIAEQKGAAGAIIIHTTPSAGYPFQVVQTSWSGKRFEVEAGNNPAIQLKAWTTDEATRKIVSFAGKNLDALRAAAEKRTFRPVPLVMPQLWVAFRTCELSFRRNPFSK